MNRMPGNLVFGLVIGLAVLAIIVVSSDGAEAAQYDVDLTYCETMALKYQYGLNPITFNYTVKHTGDVLSEEVQFSVMNVPPNWAFLMAVSTQGGPAISDKNPLEFLLTRGEVAPVSVTITPPLNELNKTFWMTSEVQPKKDTGQMKSHAFGVIVRQKAGWSLEVWNPPEDSTFRAIPPSTVTVRFALYNTGNGVDRFLIRMECTHTVEGWELTLVSGTDEFGFTPNLSADPGKETPHFIDVEVSIPPGTREGTTAQLVANATSMFNQSKVMPSAYVQIQALQYFNLQVYYVGDSTKEVMPGESVTFQLEVTNLGNGEDRVTTMVTWDKNLYPDLQVSPEPGHLDLDSQGVGTFDYIVTVPTNAPMGEITMTVEVRSSCPELLRYTKDLIASVLQVHAVHVEAIVGKKSTIPGGDLTFNLTIENLGNGLDSFMAKVGGVPNNWLVYIQPPELTLLSHERNTVKIVVLVSHVYREAPIGLHKLQVVVESARSDAEARTELVVVVEQLFRVEWMLGGEAVTNPAMPISQPGVIQPTPTLNPYENDQLEYQLELRNFGNGGDNITISGHSQDPRLTIEMLPTTLSLQQEETGFVTLRVTVPQGLQHGDYLVMANLSSQEPGYTVRVFLLEFTVLHYDVSVPDIPTYIDPDEGDVTVPDIVVPSGTDMLFKLVVGNNGTIPLSDVVVRGFDSYDDGGVTRKWNFFNHTIDAIAVGDQFLLGTQPSSNKNPSLSWTATRGGVHIIEFVVYHDHQADTSNDASSVTVTVDESPVVTVTSKDDRVKRGETLTITGTVDDDQGNVQWVRVRVDGGAWMDANGTDTWSFELETEGLAVGEHTLEVVAFDGLSESTLYNMTIRIDRMYSADDSPGPGLAATILVISLVASVMTMYRRAVRKGV